jgi:hypothetical protein
VNGQSPIPYRVISSTEVNDQFRALAETARSEMRLSEFLLSARSLWNALTFVPDDVGESREEYVHLGMKTRVLVNPPITVHYGVNSTERLVIIRRFILHRSR